MIKLASQSLMSPWMGWNSVNSPLELGSDSPPRAIPLLVTGAGRTQVIQCLRLTVLDSSHAARKGSSRAPQHQTICEDDWWPPVATGVCEHRFRVCSDNASTFGLGVLTRSCSTYIWFCRPTGHTWSGVVTRSSRLVSHRLRGLCPAQLHLVNFG